MDLPKSVFDAYGAKSISHNISPKMKEMSRFVTSHLPEIFSMSRQGVHAVMRQILER